MDTAEARLSGDEIHDRLTEAAFDEICEAVQQLIDEMVDAGKLPEDPTDVENDHVKHSVLAALLRATGEQAIFCGMEQDVFVMLSEQAYRGATERVTDTVPPEQQSN
jgi:polyhydroxyalkanoate synthesis regulator phasin